MISDTSKLEQLEEAIYYLKVPELRSLADEVGIKSGNSKQAMIDALLAFVQGKKVNPEADDSALLPSERQAMQARYSVEEYLVPGHYTNNRVSRRRFIEMIGPHFGFTTYGMDWIRAQWQQGKCPSYAAFAEYWQYEYIRRKEGGEFSSKRPLQRVQFFRRMAGENLSKEALEAAWKEKRAEQAALAETLIREVIASRNSLN